MISADQYLQCDVRMHQGKINFDKPFGGLAINICGDFFQLPPVDTDGSRRSLALPLDAVGKVVVDEDDKTTKTTQAHLAEARQGFKLWRSIRRVVCLTVNIRAPDALGRLQEEMRVGKISN